MDNETRVAHAIFEGVVGLLRLFAGLIRLIIWGSRKAHAVYRKHNPRPFTLPPAARFEHTHIVAGSGHGKTPLLQKMMLDDFSSVLEGTGSVVVIDSQGDMIRNIVHLSIMNDLSDRLVVIDPND